MPNRAAFIYLKLKQLLSKYLSNSLYISFSVGVVLMLIGSNNTSFNFPINFMFHYVQYGKSSFSNSVLRLFMFQNLLMAIFTASDSDFS